MSHELESLNQAFLDTLFADAHVLRITDEREISLFVEVRGDDVCAVRDMLRIHEHDHPPACYCVGGPWIDIYGHDRWFRARLAIHHALSLEYGGRWYPGRFMDPYAHGRLVDGLAFHHWLAERGVRKPLDLEERWTLHTETNQRAYREWLAAAPDCLDATHLANANTKADVFHGVLRVLESAYPLVEDRTRALLSWYSVSAGDDWMSVPAYEWVPLSILECLGVSAVTQAIEGEGVATAVLLGAARYYSTTRDGWGARATVPLDLWVLLFEITSNAGVPKNVQRLTDTIAAKNR